MDEQKSTNQQASTPAQTPTQAPEPTEPSNPTLTQSQQEVSHHTPTWIVLALLLFFTPAALYFMWKEKQYHSWFSIIIICYAGVMLLTLGALALFVIPELMKLYENLDIQNPTAFYVYPSVIGGIGIALIQIFYAVYIYRQVRRYGQLSKNLLVVTSVIVVLNYVFAVAETAALSLSVITPIFSLLNSFQ